ncbi:glycoside hydrolase family 36 protein [Vibrio sp. LaRot3]|uniref:glycoside hydrolase family 36 protein n=1 Tax=Vibrio sp. LaRot3 TaxID=2998829 RepID=UPI0022CDEC4C|nr:alpha-galactosidase [Vibrio sp. LaRot3]MDA0147223.1 alpha-galactosidase [Vibrio sp. LaRot3]
MPNSIVLDCQVEVHISNANLKATLQGNELHFSYSGLSNDPIGSDYALFHLDTVVEQQATLYGDGFQMLAQTKGQLDNLQDIGRCPDNSTSYRIYPVNARKRFYNYLVIGDSIGYTLFGFTSCNRFAGYFSIAEQENLKRVTAYIDGEETLPQQWSSLNLESVVVLKDTNLSRLYQRYSQRIANHHPIRNGVVAPAPTGWCSWYAYYANVSEHKVLTNLAAMAERFPKLDYLLIDDGYQAYMGDWLTPSDKFTSGVQTVIEKIKALGKKPAIWLAPFIAQAESELFRQHPDWFVHNDKGEPMKAEEVTYAGWRCTPWYILDMTNPDVQEHITQVVAHMRNEWGIELFKLDANYWGTLKGIRYQSGITGVEAYRMGMEAISEGAGDALLLGCNAPMWPSLGLVDIMRVSDDVERDERRFEQIAKETFLRSWQHRRLWQIDPDCATFVSLPNQATERKSYDFHRTVLLASAGTLMSGDPLCDLTPFAKQSLDKLLIRQTRNQDAVKFSCLNLHHGYLRLTHNNDLHCLFNYQQPAREVTLTADHPVDWHDYWSGEKLNQEPVAAIEVTLESGLAARAILTVG